MKISVIIPTYKPKDYLWECLESLSLQTFLKSDFEVILVLNGCSDPWKTSINRFIADKMQCVNINFVQIDQGGVSNARNVALNLIKGEYVTFIDDDDFVSPSYLKELYEKASLDTVSLCYAYAFRDGNLSTQLQYRITSEYLERSCFGKQKYPMARKIFSGPCMKLFHKSIIQGRKYDINFANGEDSLYMFLVSDRLKYVEYTSKNAVYYRRFRENSAVTKKRSRKKILLNGLKLIICYSKIYLSSPLKYNFVFYITRIFGTIKGMIY